MNILNKSIEEKLKSYQNHILIPLEQGKDIKAYYLKANKNTRIMSTLLVFTPEGIAIMGDMTPTDNGTISTYGYGLDWFAGRLNPDYLASKFLKEKWVEAYAIERLQEEVADAYSDLDSSKKAELEEIIEELKSNSIATVEQLYEKLLDLEWYDTSGGMPGYNYDPDDLGWLCAIQQTFARLYKLESI